MTALLVLLLPRVADAEELAVGGYLGHLATPDGATVPSTFTAGVRVRGRWSERFGAEWALGVVDGRIDPRLELDAFLGDTSADVVPFVAAGPGVLVTTDQATWFADAGLGIDAALFPWLDLRADGRYRLQGPEASGGFLFTVGLQPHSLRNPDQDDDGITDRDDECPEIAEDPDGFEDADGCADPDNDADKILDVDDRCPEPEDPDGFEDTDGCPDPDNDADGVPDGSDRCADAAEDPDGFEDEDGCAELDNDGDGVPDRKDGAPNEPETMNDYQDRDGIPDEVPAEVARFSGRIEGIRFESGKAVISPSSKPLLDEAAKVLAQFADVRLVVQGHTDDQGDDAKNLALSQARAEAVVAYLVAAGVSAERLVAKGFGETKPEVPNTDATSRARNRRVEFHRMRAPDEPAEGAPGAE